MSEEKLGRGELEVKARLDWIDDTKLLVNNTLNATLCNFQTHSWYPLRGFRTIRRQLRPPEGVGVFLESLSTQLPALSLLLIQI